MDAVNDPAVKMITVMKSARCGYTRILDNVIGYFVHQDPAPILVVQPRVEDAEDYSRTEIAPLIRDTPVLSELLVSGTAGTKDPDQRIAKRVFRNGSSVSFVGANSPSGFRRITVRIACFDEVDGYPIEGAGREGDQIMLGIKRTDSFWNRKIILGSTPTVKGMSRIERSYAESDQRHYHVPCPHCGHSQVLEWANLRWDEAGDGRNLPGTAHFVCTGSGCIIEEHHKPAMLSAGVWKASREFSGHAGFHIWAAYSLFPNASWPNLVRQFLKVKTDPVEFRTFVNTTLGETWEEPTEQINSSSLIGRGENYGPESIPDAVKLLTAGVDTQGDRLELQVIGFGAHEETWVVDYEVIHGDPAQSQVWQDLDKLLIAEYHTDTGRELRIRACCIDMGGHHGNQVLQFCNQRFARNIHAIKGSAGVMPIWPKRVSRTSANHSVFVIGSDTAKDVVYGRLRIMKIGPGFIHFPVGFPFNQAYFDQLTSEQVTTRYRQGRASRVWVLPPGRRNEALDTFAYALAARHSVPIRLDHGRDSRAVAPNGGDTDAVVHQTVSASDFDYEDNDPSDQDSAAPPKNAVAVPETEPQHLAIKSVHAQGQRPWLSSPRRGWFERG